MTDELNKMGEEMVEVVDRWIPPARYASVTIVELGKPLSELYPKGMYYRMLGDQILEVENLTKEEALEKMTIPG